MSVNSVALATFTTDYSLLEDRIRITGRAVDGGTVTVWLNLRMMRMLLPVLADWVEKKAAPAIAGASQLAQQAAASFAITPQPAVQCRSDNVEWLAITVDYAWSDAALRLTFRNGEGANEAVISFDETLLRQWMAIVYRLYMAAEWPMDAWPVWVASGVKATEIRAGMLN